LRAELAAHAFESIPKNSGAAFAAITEASESKEFAQTGSLDLVPTHSFKISGSYADQPPALSNGGQKLRDTWTNLRHDLAGIALDLAANHSQCLAKPRFERTVVDVFSCQRGAQDRKVRFPVVLNAFDRSVHAVSFEHGLMQCVPVHQVSGDKQGAVNVKNVGIGFGQENVLR